MNTWRMNGSQERAVSPSMPFTVGTVRQPITCWPSDCTTCSNFCSMSRRTVGLRGRKMMPLPYSPAGGRGMRAFLQISSLNACGIWISTPAPSPVLISQPQAPRWSRFLRTWMACSRMRCDLYPLMLATKPSPQASCSNCGSYRPCFSGRRWAGRGVVVMGSGLPADRKTSLKGTAKPGGKRRTPCRERQNRGYGIHMTCGLPVVNAVQHWVHCPTPGAAQGRRRRSAVTC